jgi:hypothetical protein
MAGYLIADVTTATDPALWASDHYRAALQAR